MCVCWRVSVLSHTLASTHCRGLTCLSTCSSSPLTCIPRHRYAHLCHPHRRQCSDRCRMAGSRALLRLAKYTTSTTMIAPPAGMTPGSQVSTPLCLSKHTHTRLTGLFPRLPGSAGTRKVKTIWILLKQETVSGSGISWAICKSAPSSRQIITPAPHRSVFLQAGCPSCRPTNSFKALKALSL